MFVIWNVLAMPRRLIASGASLAISCPRNRTRPTVGT